jgi:hypothetical protein
MNTEFFKNRKNITIAVTVLVAMFAIIAGLWGAGVFESDTEVNTYPPLIRDVDGEELQPTDRENDVTKTPGIQVSTSTPSIPSSGASISSPTASTTPTTPQPIFPGSNQGSSGSSNPGISRAQPVTSQGTPTVATSSQPQGGGGGVSGAQPITNQPTPTIANINPTVSLSSVNTTAQGSFTIFANATDSDGSILRVEFYSGTTRLGEDTTLPYSFVWSNVSAGTYVLSVRATDNRGGQAISQPLSVAMSPQSTNVAPVVSLSVNSSLSAPATITLNANASDSDGTVSRVEFYNGTTRLGEDMTAPYSFTWSNAGAGTYTFTARATDNYLDQTVSAPVSVTVAAAQNSGVSPSQPLTNQPTPTIANQNPTVSLTINSSLSAPATVTLNAAASDSDGTIARVEFYQGTTRLGEDTTAPYSYTLLNVAAGTYTFTARATDNRGGVTVSPGTTVTIAPANVNPTVSLSANSGVYAPATVTLSANASDSDGSILGVQFYSGSTYLGEDTSAPYAFTWSNVGVGTYSFTARATDNRGAETTSAATSLTISHNPNTILPPQPGFNGSPTYQYPGNP